MGCEDTRTSKTELSVEILRRVWPLEYQQRSAKGKKWATCSGSVIPSWAKDSSTDLVFWSSSSAQIITKGSRPCTSHKVKKHSDLVTRRCQGGVRVDDHFMTATDGTLSEREEARLWFITVGRTGVTATPRHLVEPGGREILRAFGSTLSGKPVIEALPPLKRAPVESWLELHYPSEIPSFYRSLLQISLIDWSRMRDLTFRRPPP